jgi:hypothetical protein
MLRLAFPTLTQLRPPELTLVHCRRATGPAKCHLRQSGFCDYRSPVRNKVLGSPCPTGVASLVVRSAL